MKELFFFSLILMLCFGTSQILPYVIPELTFEKWSDRFEISIPESEGVERVAFNVNRNRPFKTFEQGDFSEQVRNPTNGRYVFEVKRSLEDDDIIYVWLSVQYQRYIYRKICDPITAGEGTRSNNNDENKSSNPSTTSYEQPTSSKSCEKPLTIVTRRGQRYQPRCRGEEIFSEEFKGNALNTNVWTVEVRLPPDTCEDEFVVYNTSSITVMDDHLSIRATPWDGNVRQDLLDLGDKCTEIKMEYCSRRPHDATVIPPIVSGRINTKSSFSFQYGRIVARVKFPIGDWLYPLLLLEPAFVPFNEVLPCLHTRIAFVRGNEHFAPNNQDIGAHYLSGGVVLTESQINRNQFMVNRTSMDSFSDVFHIYELIWNENSMVFKIDGQEYGQIRVADLPQSINMRQTTGLLEREFALTLGLAAGGHADFPDNYPLKPWNNTSPKAALNFWQQRNAWITSWTNPDLKVDYIRVYAV